MSRDGFPDVCRICGTDTCDGDCRPAPASYTLERGTDFSYKMICNLCHEVIAICSGGANVSFLEEVFELHLNTLSPEKRNGHPAPIKVRPGERTPKKL